MPMIEWYMAGNLNYKLYLKCPCYHYRNQDHLTEHLDQCCKIEISAGNVLYLSGH